MSSGSSVYEDPLGDTPRTPRLLLEDDMQIFSNEHFHADSAESSASSGGSLTDLDQVHLCPSHRIRPFSEDAEFHVDRVVQVATLTSQPLRRPLQLQEMLAGLDGVSE